MSPSEASGSFTEAAELLERAVDAETVDPDTLCRIVSVAVRLYAGSNEGNETATAILDSGVSTTDAVIVATALLKARDLNPFDLALWFSRDRIAG